jgi:hypothetical protein
MLAKVTSADVAHGLCIQLHQRGMMTQPASAGVFQDDSNTTWPALSVYIPAELNGRKSYAMSWSLNVWALHVTEQSARFFWIEDLEPLRTIWTAAVANQLVQAALEARYNECVPL